MLELKYSYLPCRSCVGKMHCQQCADDICRMLTGRPEVVSARGKANKEEKILYIELAPGADEDAVLDALDVIGVFV
ncbi:MAG: hypothetical protein IKQ10_08515 [Oscillospiraceae bacterium]|nr:hypothetical protein [Oscillospiraceae bacterium]